MFGYSQFASQRFPTTIVRCYGDALHWIWLNGMMDCIGMDGWVDGGWMMGCAALDRLGSWTVSLNLSTLLTTLLLLLAQPNADDGLQADVTAHYRYTTSLPELALLFCL
jgi:hypothetical protein